MVDHALASERTWVRFRPRPTTEWITNQPLPQSLRGNLKPDRATEITGHSDLRSPCPGIIRLAGRTAGKNPSSQSEAARCTPGALTGRCPAVPGTSRPDSRGVQAWSLSLSTLYSSPTLVSAHMPHPAGFAGKPCAWNPHTLAQIEDSPVEVNWCV